MKVKFFADDFNGRLTWNWKDGEHVTSDSSEIEHLVGLGIRHESYLEPVELAPEKPAKAKGAKPAVKMSQKKGK